MVQTLSQVHKWNVGAYTTGKGALDRDEAGRGWLISMQLY